MSPTAAKSKSVDVFSNITPSRDSVSVLLGVIFFSILIPGAALISGKFDRSAWVPLWLFASLASLIALPIYNRFRSANNAQRVKIAIRSKIGRDPDFLDIREFGTRAIGLGRGYLFILEGGFLGAIPLEAIREWEASLESYQQGHVVGFAPAASLQLGVLNSNARHQAEQASGLFVRVADVSNPVWHFQSADEALLQQWHEILMQAFEMDQARSATAS